MDVPVPGELVDESTGERFYRTLVGQFRAGNHLWDRHRRVVRTVAQVETLVRIHCDPEPGQPDFLDFPVHGPEVRQWGSKGVPVSGQPMSSAELDASWEHRDLAASEDRPPHPSH